MHSKMATAALLVVSLMLLTPMTFSLLANTTAPSHGLGGPQLGPIFLSQIFVDLAAMLPLAFTIKVSNSWVMASFMAVGSLDAWR